MTEKKPLLSSDEAFLRSRSKEQLRRIARRYRVQLRRALNAHAPRSAVLAFRTKTEPSAIESALRNLYLASHPRKPAERLEEYGARLGAFNRDFLTLFIQYEAISGEFRRRNLTLPVDWRPLEDAKSALELTNRRPGPTPTRSWATLIPDAFGAVGENPLAVVGYLRTHGYPGLRLDGVGAFVGKVSDLMLNAAVRNVVREETDLVVRAREERLGRGQMVDLSPENLPPRLALDEEVALHLWLPASSEATPYLAPHCRGYPRDVVQTAIRLIVRERTRPQPQDS